MGRVRLLQGQAQVPARLDAPAPAVLARLELHGLDPARVPAGHGRGQALPAQEQRRAARDRQAHGQGRLEAQARDARRLLAGVRQRAHLRHAALARQGQAGRGLRAGRQDGKILWKRLLPSRTESSPVFDNDRIYFGSENGTVYSCAPATAPCAGSSRPRARSRAGSRWPTASSTSATTPAASTRSARPTATQVWNTGTKGGALGLKAGNFYSTPAVAYGRVYVGNTDGKMYSFSSANGKLAWTKGTGSYVYSSPAVAPGPGRQADGLLRLLRRRLLRARRAQRQGRWTHRDGGKISGGATVVGDIVYFSNYGKKDTTGLGARTARRSSTWAAARSTPSSPTGARSS